MTLTQRLILAAALVVTLTACAVIFAALTHLPVTFN